MGASICEYIVEVQARASPSDACRTDRAAARVKNPLVGSNGPRATILVRDAVAGKCIAPLTDGRTDLKTGSGARMVETNARVGTIIGKRRRRERCRDDRAVTSRGGFQRSSLLCRVEKVIGVVPII